MLGEFLKENAGLFAADYQIVGIDTQNMANGQAVADRLRNGRNDGIPWMVILDANGTELASSFGPDGNIGCPISPEEIDYFVTMIKQTRQNTSPDKVTEIAEALEAHALKYRKS